MEDSFIALHQSALDRLTPVDQRGSRGQDVTNVLHTGLNFPLHIYFVINTKQ